MQHAPTKHSTSSFLSRWLLVFVMACGLCGFAQAANSLELAPCASNSPGEKRTLSGLFRVHVICDRLLWEIPPELFGRDLLVYTEISQLWTTDSDIVPGIEADSRMMRWRRRGHVMDLALVNRQMRVQNIPALERGLEAVQLGYIVRSFDIISEGSDGAPIIDATPMFAIDATAFALPLKQRFRMTGIDPRRSYVASVKAFPDNVRISFYQTWLPDPKDLYGTQDSGAASAPPPSMQFLFHTNMLLLPREPMRARYWDARVGYFNVPFDDFGTQSPASIARAFIMRYRLEKENPGAPLSEPVQPIVFYLSGEVPERWRPHIKRGVEDWQLAFEAAGFKRAIIVRDAPSPEEDPDWDPEDARYSVIRWVPSTRQKALGPSLVDPRSGEVVSSHLILWHDVLRLVESWYFTHAAAVDPRAQNLPLDDELMGELLRYVVSHELGHALGLRHNFKAASAYSVDQLRDSVWTRKWGTSASIMSYGRVNYVAQPGDGAALLPRFGPYDFYAIHWGYHLLPGMAPEGEWTELDRLAARQVEEPMLRFGGEDEAGAVDPSVTTYVLGSDPVAAADLGLRNVDRVMELLVPASTLLGRDYTRLGELYEALVMHRHRQLEAVVRLVGGVEETRTQAGRRGPPFAPVDPTRARAAVRFLAERGFAKPGRLLDLGVLRRVAPEGWLDPLQGSNIKLLEQLLDPGVFHRLAEATIWASPYSGYTSTPTPYLGPDLLRDLNEHLFEELSQPKVEIGFHRRELQRNYIHVLVSGKEGETEAKHASSKDAWLAAPTGTAIPVMRAFTSELAAASKELRSAKERPSEFRAATRGAALELAKRIEAAIPKARDRVTALHLSDLHKRLVRDR